jgi:beta-lactamase regulating signal transducer with metallopeptidase domain
MKSIFLFYFNGLPLTILLILVVLGLRYIFRKQSKRTLNYIWILLLVRLLFPFSLPADFSVIPNSSEILGIEEDNIGAQNKDTEEYANSGRTGCVENTVESGDSSGNTAVYDRNGSDVLNNSTDKTADNSVSDKTADNLVSYKTADNPVGDTSVVNKADNPNNSAENSGSEITAVNSTDPVGKNNSNKQVDDSKVSVMSGNSVTDIVLILATSFWLAGIAMMGFYYLGRQSQFRKKCAEAALAEGEKNVFLWKYAKDACVTGLVRPRIYLPENLKGGKYEMVLKHERMHIRRHDNVLLFLYFIALMLNWFNPLVWVVFAIVQQDIELACDESILLNASVEQKKEYARTILYLGVSRRTELFRAVSFGKGKLKERILHIGEEHKSHKGRTAVMIMLLATMTVLCACSRKDSKESEDNKKSENTTIATEDTTGENTSESEEEKRAREEEEERKKREAEEKERLEAEAKAKQEEEAERKAKYEAEWARIKADRREKPKLVSSDTYVIEGTHIDDEAFTLDIHEEIVGLVSYKVDRFDDGSFKLTFYHDNSRIRNNRGQLMTVEWRDFRDLYIPEVDDVDSPIYTDWEDRRNTLIFGNLDGVMFDQFYCLWEKFNSPGGEFGVIYPDDENLGGYCIFQTGSPEMDLEDGYMLEYMECEDYLTYDLCNSFFVKQMPDEKMPEEYKELLRKRYERAVKELDDGTVAPDDENSPYPEEPGIETDYIEGFKILKVRREAIDKAWLEDALIRDVESAELFLKNWNEEQDN